MLSVTWTATLLAGAFATGFGVCISRYVQSLMRRKTAATNALATSAKERILLRTQRGIEPLLGVSNWMISTFGSVAVAASYASAMLQAQALRFSKAALVSLFAGGAILIGLVGALLTFSPVFGVAIGAGAFLATILILKSKSEKRDERMREEVPDAIRSLAVAFRSGHSLPQVLAASSEECGGYLGHLFEIAADRLDMGEGTSEALSVLEKNKQIPELTFVAVALDIQHQSGGAIGPVLESAIESVDCELNLIRSLRVQTAQVKLSATIVTLMPFILIACFSMLSPNFLEPFFSSFLGLAVFSLALTMQIIGVMTVRRMLKVDVS